MNGWLWVGFNGDDGDVVQVGIRPGLGGPAECAAILGAALILGSGDIWPEISVSDPEIERAVYAWPNGILAITRPTGAVDGFWFGGSSEADADAVVTWIGDPTGCAEMMMAARPHLEAGRVPLAPMAANGWVQSFPLRSAARSA